MHRTPVERANCRDQCRIPDTKRCKYRRAGDPDQRQRGSVRQSSRGAVNWHVAAYSIGSDRDEVQKLASPHRRLQEKGAPPKTVWSRRRGWNQQFLCREDIRATSVAIKGVAGAAPDGTLFVDELALFQAIQLGPLSSGVGSFLISVPGRNGLFARFLCSNERYALGQV